MADEERGRYAGRGGDALRVTPGGKPGRALLAEIMAELTDEAVALAHAAIAAKACKSLGPLETASIRVSAGDLNAMLRTHTLDRVFVPGTGSWMLTLTPRLDPAPAAA